MNEGIHIWCPKHANSNSKKIIELHDFTLYYPFSLSSLSLSLFVASAIMFLPEKQPQSFLKRNSQSMREGNVVLNWSCFWTEITTETKVDSIWLHLRAFLSQVLYSKSLEALRVETSLLWHLHAIFGTQFCLSLFCKIRSGWERRALEIPLHSSLRNHCRPLSSYQIPSSCIHLSSPPPTQCHHPCLCKGIRVSSLFLVYLSHYSCCFISLISLVYSSIDTQEGTEEPGGRKRNRQNLLIM